jgi:hypothetical protein
MMVLLAEERRKVQEKGGVSVGVGGDKLDSLDLENVLVKVFEPRQSRDNVGRRAVPATEAGGGIGDDDKLSMAATFTKINKAKLVKLLNLPSVATKRTRDIIGHAAPHFRDAYPAMFATLAQCHASHLNLDTCATPSSHQSDIEQEVGERRQAREVDVDEEQQAAGMVR